jgi:hypothetical protein
LTWVGIDTVEIGGKVQISLATTPDGIELQRNPSAFKMNLVKRVFLSLMEQWFHGIRSDLKDAAPLHRQGGGISKYTVF